MDLRIAKLRALPERKNGFEAQQQLLKAGVVHPRGQLGRFEMVGELLVGHKGLLGLVCVGADQRKSEVVGEKADRIQEYSLLPEGAGQQGTDFVDDQHPHFQLPGK